MSHEDWKYKISFEIGEIDKLIKSYSVLLIHIKTNEPDLIEITAMATVLHSFYNGVEKIFEIIGKEIDGELPTGIKWHRDLLIQMSRMSDSRNWIISGDLLDKLNGYLGFRHFYRHAYSFQLKWEKLKDLSIEMTEVWEQIKKELQGLLQ